MWKQGGGTLDFGGTGLVADGQFINGSAANRFSATDTGVQAIPSHSGTSLILLCALFVLMGPRRLHSRHL